MDKFVYVIDNGTQSIRGMLFDKRGNMRAKEKISFTPYECVNPGWAEKDPEFYWKTVCEITRKVKIKNPDLFDKIAAVTVTTQRDTVVNLDGNGKPLRPAIIWLDQRKTYNLPKVSGVTRFIHSLVGMDKVVDRLQIEVKVNWIQKYQPEIWEKTEKYLLLSGYLNYRLTDQFKDSVGSQIGHIPFDYKNMCWADPHDFKWTIFPLKKEQLPEIVHPQDILGYITEKASSETGLKNGIPVIASGSDKGCETIGLGVIQPEVCAASFGTTLTVQTTTKKYKEVDQFIPPYPAVLKNYYNTEIQIYRGFWMISWFKNEFGSEEVKKATETGKAPEELMNSLLDDTPSGALGLITQPFWSPGVKYPGPEAKGSIIGFGDIHSKKHLYRSIVEGLGYSVREGIEKTEKKMGKKMECIVVGGGGSQSDRICQIQANITGKKVKKPLVFEASGLGGAIVGFLSLGEFSNPDEAINQMVRYDKEFIPSGKEQELYTQLYQRVYKKIYKKLKPIYEEIRDITHYPEYY